MLMAYAYALLSLIDGISEKVWNDGGDGHVHSKVGDIPGVVSHGLAGHLLLLVKVLHTT